MNTRAKFANFLSGGAVVREKILRVEAKRRMRAERIAIQARYEAAYWNTLRSYLPGFLQGAREDISSLPRQEIMRRVRYFEKNSGVLLKVLQCLDVNVIGAGITPSPAADDTGWGKKALAWWDEWAEVADVTEQSTVYELQSIAYRAQNIDGDSFIHLTTNAANRPAVDVIEAHRVGTGGAPAKSFEDSGFKLVDGVVLDGKRRPVAYLIQDDFDGAAVRPYTASEIVKLFCRKRAGQYRGISLLHAAILDLHDLDDLQKFEMRAAKDAASISKTVMTAAQAATVDGDAIGAPLTALPNTDPATRQQWLRPGTHGPGDA